jgi:predicted DNA binding CopG/RHH family protein
MSKATISAEEFDRLVDENKEDVTQYLDLESARRPGPEGKRINIDLPNEFLAQLDREAARRGITRQSLIKAWLYDRLHNESGVKRHKRHASGSIVVKKPQSGILQTGSATPNIFPSKAKKPRKT